MSLHPNKPSKPKYSVKFYRNMMGKKVYLLDEQMQIFIYKASSYKQLSFHHFRMLKDLKARGWEVFLKPAGTEIDPPYIYFEPGVISLWESKQIDCFYPYVLSCDAERKVLTLVDRIYEPGAFKAASAALIKRGWKFEFSDFDML